jgi:hypothetical protein
MSRGKTGGRFICLVLTEDIEMNKKMKRGTLLLVTTILFIVLISCTTLPEIEEVVPTATPTTAPTATPTTAPTATPAPTPEPMLCAVCHDLKQVSEHCEIPDGYVVFAGDLMTQRDAEMISRGYVKIWENPDDPDCDIFFFVTERMFNLKAVDNYWWRYNPDDPYDVDSTRVVSAASLELYTERINAELRLQAEVAAFDEVIAEMYNNPTARAARLFNRGYVYAVNASKIPTLPMGVFVTERGAEILNEGFVFYPISNRSYETKGFFISERGAELMKTGDYVYIRKNPDDPYCTDFFLINFRRITNEAIDLYMNRGRWLISWTLTNPYAPNWSVEDTRNEALEAAGRINVGPENIYPLKTPKLTP